MNAAHIHLMLNHFPIVGLAFSIPLLLAAWRLKNEHLRFAALFMVLCTGLLTVAAFLTGEPAEKIAEHLPGVTEKLIEAHEEAAETSMIATCITAFAALVALGVAFKKKAIASWSIPVVSVLAIVSVGLTAWTNNLGGKIRHSELRPEAPAETK